MLAETVAPIAQRVGEDRTGWMTVRFGDVVRNVDEHEREPLANGIERFVGLEHLDPESLRIRRWGVVAEGTSFTRRFRPGHVLFGKRRAYQRKAAVAEWDGICSGDILVFEAKGDRLNPELLPFIVQGDAFVDYALSTSAGSLSPRTRWSDLAEFEFTLPPLEEQQWIAEVLRAATDSRHHFDVALIRMGELRNSLLAHEFGQEHLTQNDLIRCLPLGEIVSYASDGPFGSKLKTEHYAPMGARVVRLQNIGDGEFDDADRAYIALGYFAELRRYALMPNDVLVAGLGDENHPVGRACLVPPDLGPAINKADCFCLRANEQMVRPHYLNLALACPFVRQQIRAAAQGTTRLRINVRNIKSVFVPVFPLDVQDRVISTFAELNQSQRDLQDMVNAARILLVEVREALLGRERL